MLWDWPSQCCSHSISLGISSQLFQQSSQSNKFLGWTRPWYSEGNRMTTATLQVEHVTKGYGSGATEVTAVRDVSLSVTPREIVLIMGPSGSGKTTLLSMLGALLKPTEGEIHLNGDVISALAENRLPGIRLRQFGFIFQDFNLLSALTALENVAIVAELAGAKNGTARKKAAALLSELGLAERLNFLPEKLSG